MRAEAAGQWEAVVGTFLGFDVEKLGDAELGAGMTGPWLGDTSE
jgi:hypothetical protein